MSKYLIEDAFKSLDEVMIENKKSLKEGLGKDDPAVQQALSITNGYNGGRLTANNKLQIYGHLSKGEVEDIADAINDALIDYGKKIVKDNIIIRNDNGQKIYVGNYSFSGITSDEDAEHQKDLETESLKEAVDWDYYDAPEIMEVEDKYLPSSGEGDTIASQIVTAVTKLVYKWYNDGDVFDNHYTLQGWANDLSSYANWLYKYIKESKPILNEIKVIDSEDEYEDLLKKLHDTICTQQFLNQYDSKPKTGSIYECDGPFSFSWGDDEDDDLDESVESLTEKIPKDLKSARLKTSVRDKKFDGNDMLINKGLAKRRGAEVDFEKASYKEITPEEALDLIKKDKTNFARLHFIINDRDIAYTADGECLSDIRIARYPYEKKSGEQVYDVKWWPIKFVANRADKIYYTDEEDYPINRDVTYTTENDAFNKRITLPSSNIFYIDGTPYSSKDIPITDTGYHGNRDTSTYNWQSAPRGVKAYNKLRKIEKEMNDLVKQYKNEDGTWSDSTAEERYNTLKAERSNVQYIYNRNKKDGYFYKRDPYKDNPDYTENEFGAHGVDHTVGKYYGYDKPTEMSGTIEQEYAKLLHQKNLNLYKWLKEAIKDIKEKVTRFQESSYRSDYARYQSQIERKRKEIAELEAEIKELEAKQTPELKAEDEQILNDKLSEYSDQFYPMYDKLKELISRSKKEEVHESIETKPVEVHYRVYCVDENGGESFDTNQDISSDETCIEYAKSLYNSNNELNNRVVACKILIDTDGVEQVEDLWDSDDEKYQINESADHKKLIENIKTKINQARETLNESKAFNLKDDSELIDAAAYKKVGEREDEVLVAVDPSITSEDDKNKPHVGNALLTCLDCGQYLTLPIEDLVKSDQVTEKEQPIYNLNTKCPHCGSTGGFEYSAQLSYPDSVDAQEVLNDETTPTEKLAQETEVEATEVEEPETPEDTEKSNKDESIDNLYDMEVPGFEEIQEESFNKLVNNHLTKLYENIKEYKTTNVTLDNENKLIVEGVITSTDNKELKTNFNLSLRKNNDKYLLEGSNDIFGSIGNSFTFNCLIKDNNLICEDLKCNYTKKFKSGDEVVDDYETLSN